LLKVFSPLATRSAHALPSRPASEPNLWSCPYRHRTPRREHAASRLAAPSGNAGQQGSPLFSMAAVEGHSSSPGGVKNFHFSAHPASIRLHSIVLWEPPMETSHTDLPTRFLV
jgi:hypothetical protein